MKGAHRHPVFRDWLRRKRELLDEFLKQGRKRAVILQLENRGSAGEAGRGGEVVERQIARGNGTDVLIEGEAHGAVAVGVDERGAAIGDLADEVDLAGEDAAVEPVARP